MITKYDTLKPSTNNPHLSEDSQKKVNLMKYLHQDTTLQKSILLKEKIQIERKQLIFKQLVLNDQTKVRNNAIAQRTLQEKWDSLKQLKISHFRDLKVREEQAAVTIQRHIRGYLLRIQIEDSFIEMIDKKSEALIKSSTAQALNIMLNLGVVLVPATKIIQKAFRRYLLRKKIYRLKLLYIKYQELKLEAAEIFLKHGIKYLISTKIVQHLRFLQYRESRLEEIKRNLAILVIKNYWRSRKFTYRIMREKILRAKRRLAAMQNKEAYAKYLSSIGGKIDKKVNNKLSNESEEAKSDVEKTEGEKEGTHEGGQEDMMDDEEYLEAQRIQEMIKKQIQFKVDKGKLSYGIKDQKQVMVLPLMQEKALKESPSGESKLLNITASVFAKGRTVSREVKKPSRCTLIGSPASYEHKKMMYQSEISKLRALFTPEPELKRASPARGIDYADFMAPTIAFKKKKHRATKSEVKKRETEYVPISSNLVIPTIAYSLKQQGKKMVEKKNNWSFKSAGDRYVPSLSNLSYSPVPWKPVPLNKNILVSTEYGKTFYKEKHKVKYNVVDFSSRVMTPDLPKIGKEEHSIRSYNDFDDL